MTPDILQQAWKSQTVQTQVTINAEALLKEVQRSRQSFRAMVFWLDFVEAGGSLLMIPLWFYLGSTIGLPWTWYLSVPVFVWVFGFTLVNRRRHLRKSSESGETLLQCLKDSLAQVENQIWMLRNAFWWNTLPFSVAFMAFFIHVAVMSFRTWWDSLAFCSPLALLVLVIHGVIHFMNQRTLRVELEPQRQELMALLTSLGDEADGKNVQDVDMAVSVTPFAKDGFIRGFESCRTPPRPAFRVMIVLAALAIAVVIIWVVVAIVRLNIPNPNG